MLAIIGGSSLLKSYFFEHWEEEHIKTPYGHTVVKRNNNIYFLQRHGSPPVPPHLINHKANIWALRHLGVQKIISINSVGSLKIGIKPGSFVVPDDFVSFWNIPTFFEDEAKYCIPIMDKGTRDSIIRICRKIKMDVLDEGIYIQTSGPRLETNAEISILKRFGDIVGMTMGSEATLCIEQEIPYASLCSIDNYCNGIIKTPLTLEELDKNWQKNLKTIERFLKELIEHQ